MPTLSDEQLVALTQEGDMQAFNQLASRWEPDIYRFLRRTMGNREDALDLCQEALVKAYLHIARLREGAKFKTWLYRIALNLCRDRFRSAGARAVAQTFQEGGREEARVAAERAQPVAPDHQASQARLFDLVREAMGRIPEDQRTAILLREYQGLTSEEIGEITGVPATTVRTRIFYGLKALRGQMREQGILEEG